MTPDQKFGLLMIALLLLIPASAFLVGVVHAWLCETF